MTTSADHRWRIEGATAACDLCHTTARAELVMEGGVLTVRLAVAGRASCSTARRSYSVRCARASLGLAAERPRSAHHRAELHDASQALRVAEGDPSHANLSAAADALAAFGRLFGDVDGDRLVELAEDLGKAALSALDMKERIDAYCHWAMYGTCSVCARGASDSCFRSLDGFPGPPQRQVIRRVLSAAEKVER